MVDHRNVSIENVQGSGGKLNELIKLFEITRSKKGFNRAFLKL